MPEQHVRRAFYSAVTSSLMTTFIKTSLEAGRWWFFYTPYLTTILGSQPELELERRGNVLSLTDRKTGTSIPFLSLDILREKATEIAVDTVVDISGEVVSPSWPPDPVSRALLFTPFASLITHTLQEGPPRTPSEMREVEIEVGHDTALSLLSQGFFAAYSLMKTAEQKKLKPTQQLENELPGLPGEDMDLYVCSFCGMPVKRGESHLCPAIKRIYDAILASYFSHSTSDPYSTTLTPYSEPFFPSQKGYCSRCGGQLEPGIPHLCPSPRLLGHVPSYPSTYVPYYTSVCPACGASVYPGSPHRCLGASQLTRMVLLSFSEHLALMRKRVKEISAKTEEENEKREKAPRPEMLYILLKEWESFSRLRRTSSSPPFVPPPFVPPPLHLPDLFKVSDVTVQPPLPPLPSSYTPFRETSSVRENRSEKSRLDMWKAALLVGVATMGMMFLLGSKGDK